MKSEKGEMSARSKPCTSKGRRDQRWGLGSRGLTSLKEVNKKGVWSGGVGAAGGLTSGDLQSFTYALHNSSS